jgi:hypothetical protein
VESRDDLTFSPIFNKKVSITFQGYREGVRSSIHSILQPGGESTDLEGLLSLFDRLRILKAQVPELVGDEVKLAKGDPLARQLLFWFIADVDDDSYLKHKISLNTKGPYLLRQLLDCFASVISSNVIT